MGRSKRMMVTSDPQVVYVRSVVAGWMLDTVTRLNSLNDDFFELLDWVCKDSRPLLDKMLASGKKLRIRGLTADINEILQETTDDDDFRYLLHRLDRLCKKVPAFDKIARDEVREALTALRDSRPHEPNFAQARQRMAAFFGLDETCQTVCEALYIFETYSIVDMFYNDAREYKNIRFLGYLLGLSASEIRCSVDRLAQCGLIDIPRNRGDITLPYCTMQLWDSEEFDSSKMFGQPMEGECLPLAEFNLKPALVAHAQKLMEQQDDAPVHILLYGAPGTGKTTFVRSLARESGVRAWSVNSRDQGEDSERARRSALMACLNMAKSGKASHRGDFVVVDEAERMLDTNDTFANTKDKAWLNALLERRGQRIVWITNRVSHIDPAVRRRFSLAVHFEKLGFKQRCTVWKHVLDKADATAMLSQDDIRRLAQRYPAEAAIIHDTVVQARRLYPEKEAFAHAVELLLDAQEGLQRDGRTRHDVKKGVKEFSLEGVCTKDNVQDLLDKCARVDAAMRDGADIRPGCGSMLFYGAPGTGKTALARHIADTLGRECVVKRASDLVSKFVGETEQLIAAAFRDAERQGAVLVIDEADSFIFSRDMAQRSWETTMVNEFLTALEECRCFCVCTTNRRKQLDAATMRRFAHKLEFTYASTAQALALYDTLLAPLCQADMTQEEKDSLARLDCLAPGDFHTVRSQFDPLFVDQDRVSHARLIAALTREQEQKLDTEKKKTARVGF